MIIITIPGHDYKLLSRYMNGKIEPNLVELLGRTYEASDDNCLLTATILKDKPAVRYTLIAGSVEQEKTVSALTCSFRGHTVSFDYDKSYE